MLIDIAVNPQKWASGNWYDEVPQMISVSKITDKNILKQIYFNDEKNH